MARCQQTSSSQPNFLVILCDDLGWGDLSCFGHPHIKTENLDLLASQGMRLTNCYSAAPVCSPSRTGLLTGRSPNRAGIFDWIPEVKPGASNPTKAGRHLVHMRRGEVTLPSILKQRGYRTSLVGKWHCNSRFNQPEQPQPNDFGFDHWFATQNNANPSHRNPNNFVRNGQPVGPLDGFSCQLVADEAARWIEDHRASHSSEPFFQMVTFHEPHEPVASPEELVERYRAVAENEDQAQYYANVHNMDRAVGRLMRCLDRLDCAKNTIVFFSSDNGPETHNRYPAARRSYGTPGPLKGMKLWTHEAGFRVPGIVSWPESIRAGQVIDTPVSSLDLLPTMASLAGFKEFPVTLDGTDLTALFRGSSMVRTNPLFWFYYNAINDHRVAMRDGRWKVMAKLDEGKLPKFENIATSNIDQVRKASLTDIVIYDMESDVSEANDIGEQDPELRTRLSNRLRSLYTEVTQSMHYWND
jgi:arylsulfatase A